MIFFPKISIITPCFNSIHTIQETIESVLKQNYPNLEHIVMDGGSTDGTVELLKRYPHLIWTSGKDEGHYDAMNKGIEKASGEIVAILNSDDCYTDEVLLKVSDAFRSNPQWDALFGDIIYVDGKGKEIFRRQEAAYDYDVLRFGTVCYVIHPTLFVKKTVYQRLGAYKHREFLNSCDLEFILRLGQAQCDVGHLKEFIAKYRMHEHGQSADLRVSRNMVAESLRIRRAHGCPDGIRGKAFAEYARVRRQLQKLFIRGTCDLLPGKWRLKKHTMERTRFSSNIGIDRLESR